MKLFDLKRKKGFGITEVLVAAAVLGFMYIGVMKMQETNHLSLLRIRGRDGAVEVAQQVLDSLRNGGVATIQSAADKETEFEGPTITKSWARGLGSDSKIEYTTRLKVSPENDYVAEGESEYESVRHVFAKKVEVTVYWKFQNSDLHIAVTDVIR